MASAVSIVETTTGPRGVACLLEVAWPDPEDARRDRQRFYQVYLVSDGFVTEIQGHDDEEAALAAISAGANNRQLSRSAYRSAGSDRLRINGADTLESAGSTRR